MNPHHTDAINQSPAAVVNTDDGVNDSMRPSVDNVDVATNAGTGTTSPPPQLRHTRHRRHLIAHDPADLSRPPRGVESAGQLHAGQVHGHPHIATSRAAVVAQAEPPASLGPNLPRPQTLPRIAGNERLPRPRASLSPPDAARTPVVRYPADGARFPQAMQPIVFQHDRGTGNDVVRLHITSDVLDLSILTGGDRYQPDDAIWTLIAASHPRSSATLTIEATSSTTPSTFSRGAPIDLAFSGGEATDLLYLFSTGAGVVRGSLAAVSTAPIAPGKWHRRPTG